MPGFADHFSIIAAEYAAYRPRYPEPLFDSLAALAPRRDLAWDCATGSGQAAVGLARLFDRVIATDASRSQVERATPHPRVSYSQASAEASGLPAGSAALITVAQALHWLDLPGFYAEARRVLAPGGLLAVWTYGRHRVDGGPIDALLNQFYDQIVGPYWAPERRHVESGYRTLPFPFDELALDVPPMVACWTLPQMLGYMGTWSAVVRCAEVTGSNPVPALGDRLAPHWNAGAPVRRLEWPLYVRAGR
ncbi:MAG: class I SAM-dependent methyltransferase [Gemmatimonadales bacterium]|nr:class I SAM-dependent methyltransferase [Gemmatimonadales bacterium]